MIFTTVGLLISMAAASDVTAVAGWNESGQPVLRVTTGGRTHVLGECAQPDLSYGANGPLSQTVSFHGSEFKAMDGRVVNARTGVGVACDNGAPECQGGMALKRHMLWLFATFQDSDYMGRFVTSAHVYVIGEKAGVPILEKTIDLGPVGLGMAIDTWRCADNLLIRGSLERYALLNFENLKLMIMPAAVEAERPVRPTQDAAISDSGRIYWQNGPLLKELDWDSTSWKPVRSVGTREGGGWITEAHGGRWGKVPLPHDWEVAIGVDRDDLLVSPDLIAYAHRDCSCLVPPSMSGDALSCHIFLDRPNRVGVAWLKKDGQVQGSLLDLKNLSVVCPITGRL
jgi:hypothetical protein